MFDNLFLYDNIKRMHTKGCLMQMKYSIHQVDKKIKAQNNIFNNEIRKRFSQQNMFGEVRELEYIEKYMEETKSMDIYCNGGFSIDRDVLMMINSLRERCIDKLKKEAADNLEWYERWIRNGQSPDRIQSIYSQAMHALEKADKIRNNIEECKEYEVPSKSEYRMKTCIYMIAAIAIMVGLGILLGF